MTENLRRGRTISEREAEMLIDMWSASVFNTDAIAKLTRIVSAQVMGTKSKDEIIPLLNEVIVLLDQTSEHHRKIVALVRAIWMGE